MFDLSTLQLTIFAAFGGFIGFFAFSNKPSMTRIERCFGLLVSVGIGVILALPVHAYLVDYEICSKHLADMIVGVVGLGMPDLVKTNLPQLQKLFVEKFLRGSINAGKVKDD
jgi:hypothetical protein